MNDRPTPPPRLRVVPSAGFRAEFPDRDGRRSRRPDWLRLLRDVTACGLVRLQTGNPAARLHTLTEPWCVEARDRAMWLEGPGLAIAALTERWAQAAISQGPCSSRYTHLDIGDHLGRRLLRLSLTDDSDWSHFSARRIRDWARTETRLDALDGEALRHRLARLQERSADGFGSLQHGWYDARREHLPGTPVSVSRLAPLLETLSDQVCPLRVLIGNRGLLQSYAMALFDYRLQASMLRLRSSVAELELDLERLAGARVTDAEHQAASPWLRLYDDQSRCVASLGLDATAEGTDRELWKVLLRALSN